MTTPTILKSNLREKFGVAILIADNPTIKETIADMDKIESEKNKTVEGLAPKYLYGSLGLLGAGVVTLLGHISKVQILENVSPMTMPALITASAVSLALSIGVPMYKNYKHLQAKNDLKDVALKVNKLKREDRGFLTYMTIEEFSNLQSLTFSDKMKEEYSKVIEEKNIFNKLKKITEKIGLLNQEGESKKEVGLVFKR